jgi:uncharacterized protein (DUF1697 family)
MPRYVAFLRGINVSGQKLIKMQDLRAHFELPSFSNVVTYIQSGNVLFDCDEKKAGRLKNTIEQELEKKLGYAVPVIVRSLTEISKVVQNNPFAPPQEGEKVKLYVCFLSATPDPAAAAALAAMSYELEQLQFAGTEAYLCSASYGSTKFPNTLLEKKLGVQSTVRNWNTVNKVLEL